VKLVIIKLGVALRIQMSHKIFQSELIKAGAGAGKTYQLIQKVLELFNSSLDKNVESPRLIVCTFTKKASQELKDRLFKEAMKQVEFSPLEEKKIKFLHYLSSPSLKISTIDGILHQFLKKYGHFIQLNPDFEISDSSFNKTLFDSFSENFIYKKHFSLLKKIPYPHLKNILLSCYKYCIQYGHLSFYDEKDFQAFQKERDHLMGNDKKIVSELAYRKYLKENSQSLLNKIDYKEAKKLLKESENFSVENFVFIFKEMKIVAEEFFSEFIKKKKISSFLAIEDLLLFSYYLLNQKPEVAESFNKEWDYWLIDEYQDTSFLQEQVLNKITQFKNVFCVGDFNQSIYSFRGAEPKVFLKREKALKNQGLPVKHLSFNYRSSSSLISFYNDFFDSPRFIKSEAPPDTNSVSDISPISFFTYDFNEQDSVVLSSLYNYIEFLKNEKKASYDEIVILSSKNKDLIKIEHYLREKNIPLMLYSSKKFSKNRQVLDSLFLLKFLINPYDNENLKALLRTPYFRLCDQELADSSYEYKEMKKDRNFSKQDLKTEDKKSKDSLEPILQEEIKSKNQSFWFFIKDKYKKEYFVEALSSYLRLYKQKGLFESFRQALFDSGIIDLSYFQDSSTSSLANLWKLLCLLKQNQASPLKLFYKLMEDKEENDDLQQAPISEGSQFIELMSIHKSKGLEFKHVIILDFSISKSSFKKGNREEAVVVYDLSRKKMSFSVPIGGRNKKKQKNYGHKLFSALKKNEELEEHKRLFYVAMTRAKESLVLFIPHGKSPEKNSWLNSMESYLKKIKGLIQITKDKDKIVTWNLKSGQYEQESYCLNVRNCKELNQENLKKRAYLKSEKVSDSMFEKKLKEKNFLKISNEKASFKTRSLNLFPENTLFKSSQDFIQDIESLEKNPDKIFHSKKQIKNTLSKIQLGNQLHFFLQKLCYFSYSDLQTLISVQERQTHQSIKKALNYVLNLKDPDLSTFLKQGFSEWDFKFKKRGLILKGRIDLWFKDFEVLHVVDYKSSLSHQARKQLTFYSWVLNEIYSPKKIFMYECYPFEEKTVQTLFNSKDKKIFEEWMNKNSQAI